MRTKKEKSKELYVITGISRIDNVRTAVSGVHDKDTCSRLLADWKIRRRNKRNLPILRLRMDRYEPKTRDEI